MAGRNDLPQNSKVEGMLREENPAQRLRSSSTVPIRCTCVGEWRSALSWVPVPGFLHVRTLAHHERHGEPDVQMAEAFVTAVWRRIMLTLVRGN